VTIDVAYPWLTRWFTCAWCGHKVMAVFYTGTKMLECGECHKWSQAPEEDEEQS
jgi:transcription elongation factor Elf1